MKAMRKIVPALAMLLVSIVVMSSASFAWFTMSRQVTAQGLEVTVTAPNNLMIKVTGEGDSEYAETATKRVGDIVLNPASTTTGKKDAFYVVAPGQSVVTATGALMSNTKLTKGAIATSAVTGDHPVAAKEGAFYDFKYTIKTDGDTSVEVVVSNITITNKSSKSIVPVRVAVMRADETVLYMFNPKNGVHHSAGKAISGIQGSEAEGLPNRDTVTYVQAINNNSNANVIIKLNDTENSIGKEAEIIIRVWYEGEDTMCTVREAAKASFQVDVVLADKANLPVPPPAGP